MTLLIRVWSWFSRKISVPSCQLSSKGHPSNWLSLVLQTMLSPSSSLTPFLGYKGGVVMCSNQVSNPRFCTNQASVLPPSLTSLTPQVGSLLTCPTQAWLLSLPVSAQGQQVTYMHLCITYTRTSQAMQLDTSFLAFLGSGHLLQRHIVLARGKYWTCVKELTHGAGPASQSLCGSAG